MTSLRLHLPTQQRAAASRTDAMASGGSAPFELGCVTGSPCPLRTPWGPDPTSDASPKTMPGSTADRSRGISGDGWPNGQARCVQPSPSRQVLCEKRHELPLRHRPRALNAHNFDMPRRQAGNKIRCAVRRLNRSGKKTLVSPMRPIREETQVEDQRCSHRCTTRGYAPADDAHRSRINDARTAAPLEDMRR